MSASIAAVRLAESPADAACLARVLVVEAEPRLAQLTCRSLRRAGYQTKLTAEPDVALASLDTFRPHLVVLDMMLPGQDSAALFHQLRSNDAIAIVLLSPTADEADRTFGLNLGADDFLPTPTTPGELVARVAAVLRRVTRPTDGDHPDCSKIIAIDLARHRVVVSGQPVRLTRLEFALLAYFVGHVGKALTREELLGNVWGYSIGDLDTVTVHVRRLREKIEADPAQPEFIRTVWGVGYRLELPPGSSA